MADMVTPGVLIAGLGWQVFAFEPSHLQAPGYWTHSCGARFEHGTAAIHNPDCASARSGDGYVYHFGPAEVDLIISHGRTHGELSQLPDGQLSLGQLRHLFPTLVAA